jgi:hypothetical protein
VTYAYLDREPTYEELRAIAVKVLEGNVKSISSTTVETAK